MRIKTDFQLQYRKTNLHSTARISKNRIIGPQYCSCQ